MLTEDQVSESMAIDLARECLYRFLGAALSDPHSVASALVLDAESQRLARDAADLLRSEASSQPVVLGFGELPADQLDFGPLLVLFSREHLLARDDLRGEYDSVFGLVPARECPPYETEYHSSSETFFRSQQLADVAGFYRAFGLDPSQASPERPDHIGLELEFMAFLLMKKRLATETADTDPQAAEQACVCEEALRNFFRDHLAWWVTSFATGLRRRAGSGFYAAVAQLLAAFMTTERVRFSVDAPRLPLAAAFIERPEEQSGCAGCAAS
jgi:TorA maturation chaperone TorD